MNLYLYWETADAADEAAADKSGLVTLPQVEVGKGTNHLKIVRK